MDDTARGIAMYTYLDKRDRFGDPLIEHVARVAAAVPPEARNAAWLHEAFETGGTDPDVLREAGIGADEIEALELLTRSPSDQYEPYVLRIAYAPGVAGRLARAVKLADLDDHLAHGRLPDKAPPYAWARRHVAIARSQDLENPAAETLAS
jgi:hypothetical protein